MVAAIASGFMNAHMRTSPVRRSCTTAGISPLSSNFTPVMGATIAQVGERVARGPRAPRSHAAWGPNASRRLEKGANVQAIPRDDRVRSNPCSMDRERRTAEHAHPEAARPLTEDS